MINWLIERLLWFYYRRVVNTDILFILQIFSLLNGDKNFRFNQVNLNELTKILSQRDKGKKQIDSSQMKEFIGILGKRWRNMNYTEFMSEVYSIRRRAGLNTTHEEDDDE